MEYTAIECDNVEDLSRQVNQKIKEGWVPLGGVSVSLSETDESQYYVVVQAMTKSKQEQVKPKYPRFTIHFALAIAIIVPCSLLFLLKALGVF